MVRCFSFSYSSKPLSCPFRTVRGGKDRPGGGAPATRRSDMRPNTDVSDYNVIGNIHYRNSKKSALRGPAAAVHTITYITVNP